MRKTAVDPPRSGTRDFLERFSAATEATILASASLSICEGVNSPDGWRDM